MGIKNKIKIYWSLVDLNGHGVGANCLASNEWTI